MLDSIDISIFRSLLLSASYSDLSDDLNIFNKECSFYYDETNNNRKFWLDKDGFNAPVNNDFILGGVMYFGEHFIFDINELREKLKIQKSAKEIKFKHLSKAQTFLDCLRDEKVYIFLKWIFESD